MSLAVTLTKPDLTVLDVTARLLGDGGSISRMVEEDANRQVSGDLSVTFDDADGYFSTTLGWASGLDPQAYYGGPSKPWVLTVTKDGAAAWAGDLDVPSVTFEAKSKSVGATFLGPVARLDRHNAESCKRAIPSQIYFMLPRGKRVLTLCQTGGTGGVGGTARWTVNPTPGWIVNQWAGKTLITWDGKSYTIATNSANSLTLTTGTPETGTGQWAINPVTVASRYIEQGDIIRSNALTQDGAPVQQDLEIRQLQASDPTLTAYQAKIKGRSKKCYVTGVVSNPWYRAVTVEQMARYLFAVAGVSALTVNGPNKSMVVDEGDWKQKTVGQALQELCVVASMVLYCDAAGTSWTIEQRDYDGAASSKTIDSLLCETSVVALDDKWYDSVKVEGTAGWHNFKRAQGSNRFYRIGNTSNQKKELSIQTDLTGNMGTAPTGVYPNWTAQGSGLIGIAYNAWYYWGYRRKRVDCEVLDDGTRYALRAVVTYAGETWWVVGVEEPLRSHSGCRGTVRLSLLQRAKLAPGLWSTGAQTDDYFTEDPPYPPDGLQLGKATDDAASRPLWWGVFRQIYRWEDWPVKKVVGTAKDDDGNSYDLWARLWIVRWKYTWGDPPDGFQITVYKEGKDPSTPTQEHGYKSPGTARMLGATAVYPAVDADLDYYYWPWYKLMKLGTYGTNEKEVVVQSFDDLRGLSAYSDYVTTAGDAEAAAVAATMGAVTVSAAAYAAVEVPYILADASANPVTVTLPDAASWEGSKYTVKRVSSGVNQVEVVPGGTDTIDGETSVVLTRPMSALVVISDGSAWHIC